MYRTRVESVNGTKVFANGKCLTCIGNQRVQVGDFVWTDGACIYGHYQTSQSPLVIVTHTAPKRDMTIPISLRTVDWPKDINLLLDFYKNQLVTISDYKGSGLFMINDSKGNVYFFASDVDVFGLGTFIAVNIDNDGNFFTIKPNQGVVEIRKNQELIFSIDVLSFEDQTIDDCPAVPETPVFDTYANIWLLHGNIEDEKNWCFFIRTESTKMHDVDYFEGTTPESNLLIRYYYFSCNGSSWNYKLEFEIKIHQHYDYNERDWFTDEHLSSNYAAESKFFLQDGFYYQTSTLIDIPLYFEKIVIPPCLVRNSFFSPDGIELFSGISFIEAGYAIQKVNNSYLFGVFDSFMEQALVDFENIDPAEVFFNGLFLINDEIRENISAHLPNCSCLNHRFTATNVKDWYTRSNNLTDILPFGGD